MENVYSIIDGFVVWLGGSIHVDGTVQFPGLIRTGEGCQLADQLHTFLPGDEAGRLHGIHQELHLWQFKNTRAQEV